MRAGRGEPMTALVLGTLTALAAFAMICHALGPIPQRGRERTVRLLSVSVILGIFASAAVHRFTGVDHLLFGTDEMATLMAGIRLHLLPFWNLTAGLRDNFFKSAMMPVHGLADNVFFYLVVGVFRLVHVPVTEANLFSAGAALSMASLVLCFLLVHRCFGIGAAVAALACAAWNPSLIDFSKNGFQMNFAMFLLFASLYTYLLHVSADRWPISLLMALLMALCAGSEALYLAPVLLLLHLACRRQATEAGKPAACVSLLDRKSLVVWGAYAAMLVVDAVPLLKIGRQLDLSLLGHIVSKPAHTMGIGGYGLPQFLGGLNGLVHVVFGSYAVLFAIVGFVAVRNLRRPYALFFVGYFLFITMLGYLIKFMSPNFMHLLPPALVLTGLAAVQLIELPASWLMRGRALGREFAGVMSVVLFLVVASPWKLRPVPSVPEPYRCLKAVGVAIRSLGPPPMRVLLLSNHSSVPSSLEYYAGFSATAGDHEPPQLYYLPEVNERYYPRELSRRVGLQHFDLYVDFTLEEFGGKAAVLADLRSLGMHEVGRITSGGAVQARIYAPASAPLRTWSIEEAEATFNRRDAYWGRLFFSHNVGTFYYYGVHY